MQWFKHDSDANTDAKLTKLRMRYGMEGYGLYWYCLELISGTVEAHNLNFQLEHDSEIIAHNTGLHQEKVEQIIKCMVDLKLFENNDGHVTCMKMIKRMDSSMTSNPKMRKLLQDIKKHHDAVMMPSCVSHDAVMTLSCKKEEKEEKEEKGAFSPPSQHDVIQYFASNGYSRDSAIRAYKGYEAASWHDSTGKKVKNWKQKMIHVWFKPDNAEKSQRLDPERNAK